MLSSICAQSPVNERCGAVTPTAANVPWATLVLPALLGVELNIYGITRNGTLLVSVPVGVVTVT